MSYMIFDNDGNALAATDDRREAVATLEDIAFAAPGLEDSFALFEYDDDGHTVGQAMTVFDLPALAIDAPQHVVIVAFSSTSDWRGSRTMFPRWQIWGRNDTAATATSALAT